MNDIVAYITDNPMIAGGAAGGVVLLVLVLMLAGGGKKKRAKAEAAPAAEPPRAAEPAPAARPAPAAAPASSAGGTPGDMIFAAAADRGVSASADDVDRAVNAFKSPGAILWVDDRPETIAREADALRGLGAQVDVVTTNAEAIARLRERAYDVIVSDIDRQASEGGKAGFFLPNRIKDELGDERRVIFYVGVVTQRLVGGRHPATASPVELVQLVSAA